MSNNIEKITKLVSISTSTQFITMEQCYTSTLNLFYAHLIDILKHSLPQLYMGHYFKYLSLRYHSLLHFIQSKSYSIRLFEKTSPSPTTSYCVTYQICLN